MCRADVGVHQNRDDALGCCHHGNGLPAGSLLSNIFREAAPHVRGEASDEEAAPSRRAQCQCLNDEAVDDPPAGARPQLTNVQCPTCGSIMSP